ncbi:flavin reductase family protein [Falsihalocynthiibacter sp. SS001]|uniref:flavin reductase family protein n=1 Tax=Falsihalocynthiibacter sp. SS001 TaxID=3349698 RepID=UPI0036D2215B
MSKRPRVGIIIEKGAEDILRRQRGRFVNSFIPDTQNTRPFRDALSQFGTGITVVTVNTPNGPMGITANSFASVSLDPPLVLWSPSNASRRAAFFIEAEHYAIHILGKDQAHISHAFAKVPHSFGALSYKESEHGVPLIDGCLATFECRHHAAHEGGDHTIIVGEVERVTTGEGEPLLFHAGSFGTFHADL